MASLGMSLLYWTPFVERRHDPVLEMLRELGYDGVEVPVAMGGVEHYTALGERLREIGLAATACGFLGADADPASPDPAVRRRAAARLQEMLDNARALGAELLGGPLHSAYAQFRGRGPLAEDLDRSAGVLRDAADYAAARGQRLAVEFLNRFECYLLTTAQATSDYVRAVARPNVVSLYDTHHAHLEEDDPGAALRALGSTLGHVQLSENHRGRLGSGQVRWRETCAALHALGYDDWLVVECFSRFDPAFGAALHVWRDWPEDDRSLCAASREHALRIWEAARR